MFLVHTNVMIKIYHPKGSVKHLRFNLLNTIYVYTPHECSSNLGNLTKYVKVFLKQFNIMDIHSIPNLGTINILSMKPLIMNDLHDEILKIKKTGNKKRLLAPYEKIKIALI